MKEEGQKTHRELHKDVAASPIKDYDNQNKFRIQFDFEYPGDQGKVLDQTSHTKPDMSLTVRQLLQNHTRGIPAKGQKPSLYFDLEVPVIKDLTDMAEYKAHLQRNLKKVNEFIKNDISEADKQRVKEEEKRIKKEEFKNGTNGDTTSTTNTD